jgi:hypothetical protein
MIATVATSTPPSKVGAGDGDARIPVCATAT